MIIARNLLSVVLGASLVIATKGYFSGGSCKNKIRLDGKTVIVTGSNCGIGKETARELCRRGARVIMACRNLDSANDAAKDILKTTPEADVVVYKLDLSSMKSVRQFATEIREKEARLDILINNAGQGMAPHTVTEDGFELTIASNHLGPFLLTNLLLDKLAAAPDKPARVVNVASNAHKRGAIHIDDLNLLTVPYGYGRTAYDQSKLANILFTSELAKRARAYQIDSYSLHPGVIRSSFFRHLADRLGVFWYLLCYNPLTWLLLKDNVDGAQTTIYCATEESLASGKYYADCKITEPTTQAQDDEMAELLWNESAKLVNL